MVILPTAEVQKEFARARERIEEIKDYSKWIQIDVSDNEFTGGKTFELELIKKLEFRTDDILWEIHLMVKEPINWVEKCIFVGASRVIGQVEMMSDRELFVKKVMNEGMEAGVAFDIGTTVENIPEEVDEVLLMGRKAGFGQLELDERIWEMIKIAKIINEKREKKFVVAVDGGVSKENIGKLEEAGVDMVYSGSNYFELVKNDH